MEEIKSLIKKPITSEHLDKASNSPQQLSKRQAALIALIQRTQQRRGLPAMSAGFELQSALKNWESALKNIPDSQLSRAYEHAADNWHWQDKSHPFTEDAIADAYKLLLVEDRQRAEAERRNAAKRNQNTYRCYHCQDIGYQAVFTFRMQRWYSSQRPCVCDATPIAQRNSTPLEEPEYICGKLDEWVRVVDLEKYGAPSKAFERFVTSK